MTTPRRSPLRTRRPAVALLAGGTLVGCSAEPPALRIADARVVERTGDTVVLAFTIEGDNPNEIELPLRFAEYSLEIDGKRVFEGERSPEATLRRLGNQAFILPAPVPMSSLAGSAGQAPYRISGTLGYIAPGQIAEVLFDLGVSKPTVGFAFAGTVDLAAEPSDPPAAQPKAPKPIRALPPAPKDAPKDAPPAGGANSPPR